MKLITLFFLLFAAQPVVAQSYQDSLHDFRMNYINDHGLLKGDEKNRLSFYDINPQYRLSADVQLAENSNWFKMQTSGLMQPLYRVYGIATFTVNDRKFSLPVYQSRDLMSLAAYSDYLFLPFTDLTNGTSTYAGGRYLDFRIGDIVGGKLTIDFNKAYNPYCSYVSGKYSCPLPPKENVLDIAIEAGEKNLKDR